MTEEQLDLGPRRPNGRGTRLRAWLTARLGRRGPGILAMVALLAAGGWAVTHGALDDPPPTSRRPVATPTTPTPTRLGSDEELAGPRLAPPAMPYLRSGTVHTTDGRARGLPDGSWSDFAELADGRLVLAQEGSVTVVGEQGRRATYPLVGELARERSGAAVAWTGPDGTVLVLTTGSPEPAEARGSRLLSPACRGWAVSDEPSGLWRSCDADGNPISPDGRYVAVAHARRVTVGLLHGSPVLDARIGRVMDVAWESDTALLVVTYDSTTHESRLSRMDTATGAFDDLFAAEGGNDPRRAVLVLP